MLQVPLAVDSAARVPIRSGPKLSSVGTISPAAGALDFRLEQARGTDIEQLHQMTSQSLHPRHTGRSTRAEKHR